MTERVTLLRAYGLYADDELIPETVEQGLLHRPSPCFAVEDYTDERIAEFGTDEDELGHLINAS